MTNKILFIVFLVTFSISVIYAQTVNDKPIAEIDVDFVQIVGTPRLLSNKLTIEIDFGQENKFWSSKDAQIKDVNGDVMEFNSMIDALNFMSKNGYDFVDAHNIVVGGQNIYYYLLKKKK